MPTPSKKPKATESTEQYQVRRKGKIIDVHISEVKKGDTYRFTIPGFASPWRVANEDAWQQPMTDNWVVTPVNARKNKNHPLAGSWKSRPQ